jgi:hypothetical protein
LQRAQTLLALDQGILDQQIAAVLQIERTRIWRVRQRYINAGLKAALYDRPRSGRPTEYGDKAEAELVAVACSNPPLGQSQWILDKQCLNRRIATEAELVAEVQAWQTRRNRQQKTIDWTFTRKDADKKLKKHYVA